ncbi:diguanylate cyclase domain-containing protein [Nitrosomonas aestuarii]|uniref:diguanylate cyclase domain-containing protein n=1 Tax=Nitrosomonas aestuarii TaxID=52441 RepID=UPI0015E77382
MGSSIGITVFLHDGKNIEMLIANADSAIYQAKRKGKKWYFLLFGRLIHKLELQQCSLHLE